MHRLFVMVTPDCPYIKGRKVGKDCKQCDHFRGGIVENFVDCANPAKRPKPVAPLKPKTKAAKKAQNKRNKTRSK